MKKFIVFRCSYSRLFQKILSKGFILLCCFWGNVAYSGIYIGNGGDAVVCRDASGAMTSAELLDYYEGRLVYGLNLNLGNNKLTVLEKVSVALDRMIFSPGRVKKYKQWAQSFENDARFLTNIELVDIPDALAIGYPKGCKIEQLAIQVQPLVTQPKRYMVNKEIWDKMDEDQKAGLILHEIIYREGIESHAENSIGVRKFNILLSTGLILELNYKEYLQTLREMPTYRTDVPLIFGKAYALDKFYFWPVLQITSPLPSFFQNMLPTSVSGSEFVTSHSTVILDGVLSEFGIKGVAHYERDGEESVSVIYFESGHPEIFIVRFNNSGNSYYEFLWNDRLIKCDANKGFKLTLANYGSPKELICLK